ncbi:MAG TPA: GNAT family N-acetyltransferase [Caulobacteraceae bacterium]|nr:GNAT family N-acetyltransferase [Caulobacteraceae bacterium]
MAREPLKTARLTLRAPRADDAQRLAWLASDFDVARMTTGIPHPFGLADAEAFLAKVAASDPERDAVFAVEVEGEEGLCGMLGFHHRDERPAPEIGYWLGRPWWGRGLMTEAAAAAVAWADEDWGKTWLVSGHFADNPASGQVLVKAGFLYTGEVQQRMSKARGEITPTRMMVRLA